MEVAEEKKKTEEKRAEFFPSSRRQSLLQSIVNYSEPRRIILANINILHHDCGKNRETPKLNCVVDIFLFLPWQS